MAASDGWDFHTGRSINYRESIGKTVKASNDYGPAKLCSDTVIHASPTILDCLQYVPRPMKGVSVFEVSGAPVVKDSSKAGFKELKVVKEVPQASLDQLLGFKF